MTELLYFLLIDGHSDGLFLEWNSKEPAFLNAMVVGEYLKIQRNKEPEMCVSDSFLSLHPLKVVRQFCRQALTLELPQLACQRFLHL